MLSKNTKRVSESRKQFSKTILEQVLQFLVFESTMYILSRLLSSQVLNLQYISCSNNGKSRLIKKKKTMVNHMMAEVIII